jgi:tripeptide aminopeptidase
VTAGKVEMKNFEKFTAENQRPLNLLFDRVEALREALIARIREISEIPSPTFDEHLRTEYVLYSFQNAGLNDIRTLGLGSVLGFTGDGRGPVDLLLAAHIDNVFPSGTDLGTRIDGGILRGPGTGDNAANVAAIIALAEILNELSIRPAGNIAFCGTVREEGLGNLGGMDEVLAEIGERTGAAIAVDGQMDSLIVQSQAIRRHAVTVRGPGGHSWKDFGNPSAIHEMARIITSLAGIEVPDEPRTTFNVGKIGGGTTVNAIAEECVAEVDLRSLEPEVVEDLERKFLKLAGGTLSPGVQIETQLIGERPGGSIDAEHDLVKTAVAAARYLGCEVTLKAASTDAALSLARGIPSVCFGIYSGDGTHTLQEYIRLDSLTAGLMRLGLTVLALVGIGK